MSEITISEEAKALFDKLDILAFNDAASHECLTAIQLAINSATAPLNKRVDELVELSVATMCIAEEPRELWENAPVTCPTIEAVKKLRLERDTLSARVKELEKDKESLRDALRDARF